MSDPATFSSSDPRAVLRIVGLPVAVVGALMSHPLLIPVSDAVSQAERVNGGWAVIALATAGVSVTHLHLSMHGATRGGVLFRSAAFGMLLGPINSGICLAAVSALRDGLQPGLLGAFVLGAVFGVVAGGCIGLVLGVALSPLAMATQSHRARPTHTGPDKARALGGAMILVAAAIHQLVLGGSILFPALAAALGAWRLGPALYRLRQLHVFLRAVRDGQEPKWSLAEPRDPSDSAGLLPIHGGDAPAMILFRATSEESVGPYRSHSQWRPIARLAG